MTAFYLWLFVIFLSFFVQRSHLRTRHRGRCGPPPKIPNAYHNGPKARNDFSLETVVYYSCNNGYYIGGSGLPRAKCMIDNGTAKWVGPSIDCHAQKCGNPGTLINGVQEGFEFEYTFTVKYTCLEGYELIGSPIRKCQADGSWSGQDPQCKPVQCPEPRDPLHGEVRGLSLDFMAKITYICHEGYRLEGQTRTCQADKTWSGMNPTCAEIVCPSLGRLEHGYIRGENTTYKSIVTFHCETGAILSGAPFARCNKDGNWSNPMPKCLASCPMPRVKNGQVRKIHGSDRVAHGQQIEVKCADKFELESDEYPRCNNGEWSYMPHCLPIRCKKWPPSIRNGHVIFVSTNHSSVAKYICKSGFLLKNGNDRITCRFGTWEGDVPECDEIFCEHPNTVGINLNNGSIKLEGAMGTYEYKDYIRGIGEYRNILFECLKGFVLIGPRKATCVNGTWEPRNIKRECVEQTHNILEDIEWKVDNQSTLRSKNLPSDRFAYYQRRKRHSSLSRRTGKCRSLHSGHRRIFANIRYNADSDGFYPNGSIVLVQCRPGFTLRAPLQSHIVCLNGRWSPKPSFCTKNKCHLPTVENGFFASNLNILNYDDKIDHGIEVTLHCQTGYEVAGGDKFSCHSGYSAEAVGSCLPKACRLPYFRDGRYLIDSVTPLMLLHGSVSRFECKPGFIATPQNVGRKSHGEITCHLGEIKPHKPECVEVSKNDTMSHCRRPFTVFSAWVYIEHGVDLFFDKARRYLVNPLQNLFPNNTVIHYKCRPSGHSTYKDVHEEASAIKCINGQWQAVLYPCASSKTMPPGVSSNDQNLVQLQMNDNKIPCLPPAINGNETIIDVRQRNDYFSGDKVVVQCKFDATKKWLLECQYGRWKASSNNTKCGNFLASKSDFCTADPYRFKNLYIFNLQRGEPLKFKEELPSGTTLTFRCEHVGAMKFSGSRKIVCSNRQWSGIMPSCVPLFNPAISDSTPAILYRTKEGDFSIANTGEVFVRKSSLIELDCVQPNIKVKNHKVKWEYSNNYRKYPERWINASVVDSSEIGDNELLIGPAEMDAYRLTIFSAQSEDSGVFSCITPTGQRQSIIINIADVECPPLAENQVLKYETSKGFWLGSVAHFYCIEGHVLVGGTRAYCLEDRRWSRKMPTCRLAICPPIKMDDVELPPSVAYANDSFSGIVAKFLCPVGHYLNGSTLSRCIDDGVWSNDPPACSKVATCVLSPLTGDPNLKISGGNDNRLNFFPADKVVYFCSPPDKFVIEGRSVLKCEPNGRWSHNKPSCKPRYS